MLLQHFGPSVPSAVLLVMCSSAHQGPGVDNRWCWRVWVPLSRMAERRVVPTPPPSFLPSVQVQAEYLTQLLHTPRPCRHLSQPHTQLCSYSAFPASHLTLQPHCIPASRPTLQPHCIPYLILHSAATLHSLPHTPLCSHSAFPANTGEFSSLGICSCRVPEAEPRNFLFHLPDSSNVN